VPLLVLMSEETGDAKYKQSALRAAEYVWSNFGTAASLSRRDRQPEYHRQRGRMLSMEAYLSLYDSTKDPKWLERAKAAANFAESWIWIWNLPMPRTRTTRSFTIRRWPTVGVQGITAAPPRRR